jgi:hypothetical protein
LHAAPRRNLRSKLPTHPTPFRRKEEKYTIYVAEDRSLEVGGVFALKAEDLRDNLLAAGWQTSHRKRLGGERAWEGGGPGVSALFVPGWARNWE